MNRKRTSAAALLILLLPFAACKKNAPHLPAKVMQNVLLDIHLAEAYSVTIKDSLHKVGTKNYDTLAVCYKDIFAHYKISPQQFSESMDWYRNHPGDMDSIYAGMLTKVISLQMKADKGAR